MSILVANLEKVSGFKKFMLIFIFVIASMFFPMNSMHSFLRPSIYKNSAGIKSFMMLLIFNSSSSVLLMSPTRSDATISLLLCLILAF